MPIALLPGVSADRALETLRHEATAAANMRSAQGDGFERFSAYNEWAQQAISRLAFTLRPAEIDRLIASPRHWLIQGLDLATRAHALARSSPTGG